MVSRSLRYYQRIQKARKKRKAKKQQKTKYQLRIEKAREKRLAKRRKRRREIKKRNLLFSECNVIQILYDGKVKREYNQCGEYMPTKLGARRNLTLYLKRMEARSREGATFKRKYNLNDGVQDKRCGLPCLKTKVWR